MNITLTDISVLEATLTGHLYRANSDKEIAPGQALHHSDTTVIPIQCQPVSGHWQLLLHSPAKLNTSLEVVVTGDAIHWSSQEPLLILSENEGNFMCLHWLNQLRQGGEKRLGKQVRQVIMHEEAQFAFRPTPSRFLTPDLPGEMIAALPLLDDIGVVSRLCCDAFLPGAFEGSLVDLAQNGKLSKQPWCGFMTETTYQQIAPILGEPEHWLKVES